ncbi:hypothetical protein DUNSADRAFT_11947 [Dunaliella salina]|uniref:Encoded protein n=1 Tax=Dunaliella salina TaxID=3046 RepID=A0ABQ7GCB2_DUNSA|nr:hypothetical protein DUNSADRAFT_11947 [Dunaliella salina]|eukprot:KAF5832247.1 hypothetical protein DUNSADRAFT_11947 [Dunaliella salina]
MGACVSFFVDHRYQFEDGSLKKDSQGIALGEATESPRAHHNIVKVEKAGAMKLEAGLNDQLRILEGTVEELRRAQEQHMFR